MINILVFLLLLSIIKIIGATSSSSSPCPVIFYVINFDIYQHTPIEFVDQVDDGIFFLKNGTQFPPPYYAAKDSIARIHSMYHCAMIKAIITDSPREFEQDIQIWINSECKKLGKHPHEDCYRPRYTENVITSILPIDDSEAPTYSPTIRTYAPDKCVSRKDQITCSRPTKGAMNSECHWFGPRLGCHPIHYCEGLTARDGCIERKTYCLWQNQKCVSRSKPLRHPNYQ